MEKAFLQNQSTSFELLKVEDLLILTHRNFRTIPIDKKFELFEELTKRYHENRAFNLYHETIGAFYLHKNSYHLGKTSLGIKEDFALTLRLIDVLSKYEVKNDTPIPQDHAKYFFAIVKEFAVVVDEMVTNQKFNGDYKLLSKQLEWLKEILMKSKNSSDVVVIFENVIRNIETLNPLLLESKEPTKPSIGTLTLETPLYKLSKKAFGGLLENLHLYQESDYFKIVEHAVSKYGDLYLRESQQKFLAFHIAIMKGNLTKVSLQFLPTPEEYFTGKTREDIKECLYYPLACKNIDEFYEYYYEFLQKLHREEVITFDECFFLNYRFLKATHYLSDALAQAFLTESEIYLSNVTARLKTTNSTRLSELYQQQFIYTYLDELMLTEKGEHRNKNRLSFSLSVEKGKIIGKKSGDMIKKSDDDRWYLQSKEEPRGELGLEEFYVIEEIQQELVKHVVPLLERGGLQVSDNLKNLVHLYHETVTLQIEIDMEDKETLGKLRWGRKRTEQFMARLLKNRVEHHLLTDAELKLILRSDKWIESSIFSIVETDDALMYTKRALEIGILDMYAKKDMATVLSLNLKDGKKKAAFVYNLYQKIEPSLTNLLTSFVSDAPPEERTVEEIRNDLVYGFFKDKLESEGYKSSVWGF